MVPDNKTPRANHSDLENSLVKNHNSRTVKLTILILVAIVGVGVAWWFISTNPDTPPSINTSTNTSNETNVSGLYYATKTGTTTRVFRVRNQTKRADKILEFEENRGFDLASGNFWAGLEPALAGSPDENKLAYLENNDLIVYNLSDETKKTIIRKTGETRPGNNPQSGIIISTFDPSLDANVSGISSLQDPVWSWDGKFIGLSATHYEGGSVLAINPDSSEQLDLKNTFRYGEESEPKPIFNVIPGRKTLIDHQLFPDYLLEEYQSIIAPQFSTDGSKILAILCAKDQPDTGYRQYVDSVEEQQAQRRDCGEPADKSLVSINSSNGTYKVLSTGDYLPSLAIAANRVILPVKIDDKFFVETINMENGEATNTNVATLADLAETTITSLKVRGLAVPVVEIYYQKDGQNYVAVLDIDRKTLLANIELAENTTFKSVLVR